jgi:single-strand DNA-binding protein
MASYNKVLLIGNLTRDPQLRYTPSQSAVVEFGIATNRKWTAQDGTQREDVCFVNCNAFGRQAETINKYLTKGKPVFIEGRLNYESWTAQDGTKKSRLSVTVENFQFLSTAGAAGGGGGSGGGGTYGPRATQGGAPTASPVAQEPTDGGGYDDPGPMPHDEIPF